MPARMSAETFVPYVTIDTCNEFHACRGEFILSVFDGQKVILYCILKV